MRLEVHVSEAGAAVAGRDTVIGTHFVADQVQAVFHACHRVDLAAELRDEERVHHGLGGDVEAHLAIHRHGQLIDCRDALLRIDEQPLPVHRHDLNLDRLAAILDLGTRVQLMRALPGQDAQREDDQARNAPDHDLDLGGMRPVGRIGRLALLGIAIAPSKPQRHEDDRDNDHEHQVGSSQNQRLLGFTDGSLGIEEHGITAGQHQQSREDGESPQSPPH